VKSDDVAGRNQDLLGPSCAATTLRGCIPESFTCVKELRSLGLNVELDHHRY